MKKIKKKENEMRKFMKVLVILFVCMFVFCSSIYAGFTDPITNPDSYRPTTNIQSNNTKFIEIGGTVLGVIRTVGTLISVVTLLTLGIRYMLGSTQDKALYKETMGPYLIGAIMLFAIPNLIGILFDILVNVNVIT